MGLDKTTQARLRIVITAGCEWTGQHRDPRQDLLRSADPVAASAGPPFMIAVCAGFCRISGTILHKQRSPGGRRQPTAQQTSPKPPTHTTISPRRDHKP
jgi:hypothetical protein